MALDGHTTTPAARELITWAGVQDSFGNAAEKNLRKSVGIQVKEKTIRTITEDGGRHVDELEQANQLWINDEPWEFPLDAQGKTVGYASLDHTGVPLQGDEASRKEHRMAAVAMLYNPHPDRESGNSIEQLRYISGLFDLPEIGRRWKEHAWQVGFAQVAQKVILSDGGSGLERLFHETFPDADCVLDFWHAMEYVSDVAKGAAPRRRRVIQRTETSVERIIEARRRSGFWCAWEELDVSNGSEKTERGVSRRHSASKQSPRPDGLSTLHRQWLANRFGAGGSSV